MPNRASCQPGADLLPLAGRTFVVVDVETTGLNSADAITEVGAVRIVDGQVCDSFTQLVNPGRPIPPEVTALTGITDTLVASAPTIAQVLAQFLSWARLEEAVLVAHNSSFDVGFLTRASRAHQLPWPAVAVLDTLALARTHLPRPLVSNYRLPTLASFFRVRVPQAHRALADAHTCAAVFLALTERLAEQARAQNQVFTFSDLQVVAGPSPYEYRHQLALIQDLPTSAGIYTFYTNSSMPVYVGSASNLRNRVRSYFGTGEKRDRIRQVLDKITRIEAEPTATVLEARIGELRKIATLKPPLNRRSRHQTDTVWLVARAEGLTTTHHISATEAASALGPYRHTSTAMRARTAVALATGMAPTQAEEPSSRQALPLPPALVEPALRGEDARVSEYLRARMSRQAGAHHFEAAAQTRQLIRCYQQGVRRQMATARVAVARLAIWARPVPTPPGHSHTQHWRLHAARHGHLEMSELVLGTDLETLAARWHHQLQMPLVPAPERDGGKQEQTTDQTRSYPPAYLTLATWEEARELTRDLESDDTRLLVWDSALPWACPVAANKICDLVLDYPLEEQDECSPQRSPSADGGDNSQKRKRPRRQLRIDWEN